ncbi:MAG TPA: exodeoxyribonuclease VII large subunit [Acidobacteria bacterium]|nr:exodeoxyribonuclease VII large subunit [Acidobacteriota bacterium]HIN10546.1 exodeoxyribonuclease VII large subunit [Acidobacteriota bacterium]
MRTPDGDHPVSGPPSLPFGTPAGHAPTREVVTVSELTTRIRGVLESTQGEVLVEGEIANSRLWKTGHLYFTLRDEHAQLKAVMFRSAVRYLRFTPEDGLRVIARGRVTVYEPKGEYQIVCEQLQPQGVGALQVAFDQLKRTLEADGLFEATRKRPLPLLPRQIGVVTSLHGAALQDILKVLARRHPTAHVVIRPVRVQGEGAAGQIARGIDQLSRQEGVDVIIVGRGGGSLEDLWAFNEEPVARAIATATVPVISAVGHEIDVTISDLVADIRAATPSAAAEIVVAGRDELLGRVDQLSDRLRATLRDTVRRLLTSVLELDRRPGVAGWPARLAIRGRHAAELTHTLTQATRSTLVTRERRLRSAQLKLEAHEPGRRLEASRTRLVVAGERLGAAIVHRRQRLEGRLGDLTGRLEALSPLGVLARGYAVCWNANRTAIVRDASAVSVGDDVAITLRQGQLTCTVTGKD